MGGRVGVGAWAAVLLLPMLAFGAARANIFGGDDRRLIEARDGLPAVGLLVCEETSRRPIATLVAPSPADPARRFDIVVTVAHAFLKGDGTRLDRCAFWPEGRAEDAARIRFMTLGTTRPSRNWGADWAVAVLDRRLPPRYTPLEPLIMFHPEANALRATGFRFLLAGHNGESGPLMVSEHCGPMPKKSGDANLLDSRVFNHDCDMMPGWSGGPLMVTINSKRYVVAVNATEMNAIVSQPGEPYDGRYNANTAVRVDGRFFDAIMELSRFGDPHRAPGQIAACRVWMADLETDAHC